MNRRGFELAVSTLIIIALAVLLLIGLAYFLTGGFSKFNNTVNPFIDTTAASAIRESCNLACTTRDLGTYCCHAYDLDDEKIFCSDSRLDTGCSAASCAAVLCPAP